ncbi:amino acid permease [Streptomyces sp. NPDC059142]|uniref:amino acid permease n=1 Tax=Streptomyces sp. NPDC059142 TaxID=3346739 RepID=UPI0036AF8109
MSHKARAAKAPTLPDDARLLKHLGVEPVLRRRMTPFGNFSSTFSVMSITSGSLVMFTFGLHTGGPATMLWGWLAVGALVLAVAAALAEVTSAYPTSGALYDMANRLGSRRWGYVTGWLNLLGLIGGVAGVNYGCAQFTASYLSIQWGIELSETGVLGICAALLLLHALLNLFGIHLMSVINSANAWLQIAGVTAVVATLALVPTYHQPASFVFGQYTNTTGWSNIGYVVGIGLLFGMYSLAGLDTSAHLSEETSHAALAAPRGIMRSVWVSVLCGVLLILAQLFAIQDYDAVLASDLAPAEIFTQALGAASAKLLLLLIISSQLFAGYALVGATSRMAFAFSRDGAVPYSSRWRTVRPSNGVPANAVWLTVGAGLALVVPTLWSETAFAAVTTIAVVGTVPAYVIPVLLRRLHPERFTPGPWVLGRWSAPIGWTAVIGVVVITVLFCLPQQKPVTWATFNYSPIALVVVLVFAAVRWQKAGPSYQPPTSSSSAKDLEHAEEIV